MNRPLCSLVAAWLLLSSSCPIVSAGFPRFGFFSGGASALVGMTRGRRPNDTIVTVDEKTQDTILPTTNNVNIVEDKSEGATANDTTRDTSSWLDDLTLEDSTVDADPVTNTNNNNNHVLTAHQLEPLLQIPVSVSCPSIRNSQRNPIPVRTFLDTGALRTTVSKKAAERLGLLTWTDPDAPATPLVLGRLPAGLLQIRLYGTLVTLPSPDIYILDRSDDEDDDDDDEVELMMGLDILRTYQAVLDLKEEEMRVVVDGTEYSVPFLRPRFSLLP